MYELVHENYFGNTTIWIVIHRNMCPLPQIIQTQLGMFVGGKPERDHEPFAGVTPPGWSGCLYLGGGVVGDGMRYITPHLLSS